MCLDVVGSSFRISDVRFVNLVCNMDAFSILLKNMGSVSRFREFSYLCSEISDIDILNYLSQNEIFLKRTVKLGGNFCHPPMVLVNMPNSFVDHGVLVEQSKKFVDGLFLVRRS